MKCVALAMALSVLAAVSAGCSGRRATRADCQLIVDRVITIELGELGYRDAVFARRKTSELRERLKSRLEGCIGRSLPAHALSCIPNAQSTEALSHDCLR